MDHERLRWTTSQNFDILFCSCDVQCWWEYLCFVAFHRNGGINTSGGNGMSGKSTKFEITSDPILKSAPRGWFWYSSKDRIQMCTFQLYSLNPFIAPCVPTFRFIPSGRLAHNYWGAIFLSPKHTQGLHNMKCIHAADDLKYERFLFDQCNC